MECKINMAVTFWAAILPLRLCLTYSVLSPLPAGMYDVWYDSSNKDMDERMEEAGGCN